MKVNSAASTAKARPVGESVGIHRILPVAKCGGYGARDLLRPRQSSSDLWRRPLRPSVRKLPLALLTLLAACGGAPESNPPDNVAAPAAPAAVQPASTRPIW